VGCVVVLWDNVPSAAKVPPHPPLPTSPFLINYGGCSLGVSPSHIYLSSHFYCCLFFDTRLRSAVFMRVFVERLSLSFRLDDATLICSRLTNSAHTPGLGLIASLRGRCRRRHCCYCLRRRERPHRTGCWCFNEQVRIESAACLLLVAAPAVNRRHALHITHLWPDYPNRGSSGVA